MVDFVNLLRDDFLKGYVVFIGSEEDAPALINLLFGGEPHEQRPVLQHAAHDHEMRLIANRDKHPDWESKYITINDVSNLCVIPWNTTEQMLRSLRDDDINTIIEKFLNSQAYINVNSVCADVYDAIDAISAAVESNDIMRYPEHLTARQYIEGLREESSIFPHESSIFPNLYVEVPSVNDDINHNKVLNAAHGFGIGVNWCDIYPSLVYPLTYIAKKLNDSDEVLFTDNDFDDAFH